MRGLKARPQIATVLPRASPLEMVEDLAGQDVLLGLVDRVDGLHHQRRQTARLRHVDDGADVLREATAAVADAGEQEAEADPLSRARSPSGPR